MISEQGRSNGRTYWDSLNVLGTGRNPAPRKPTACVGVDPRVKVVSRPDSVESFFLGVNRLVD